MRTTDRRSEARRQWAGGSASKQRASLEHEAAGSKLEPPRLVENGLNAVALGRPRDLKGMFTLRAGLL